MKMASLFKQIRSNEHANKYATKALQVINKNKNLEVDTNLYSKIIQHAEDSPLENVEQMIENTCKQTFPVELELAVNIITFYYNKNEIEKLEKFLKNHVNKIKAMESTPIEKIISLTGLLSTLFFKSRTESEQIAYLPDAQQKIILEAIKELAGQLNSTSITVFIDMLERILTTIESKNGLHFIQFCEDLIRGKTLSHRISISRNYMIHAAVTGSVVITQIFFPHLRLLGCGLLPALHAIAPLKNHSWIA